MHAVNIYDKFILTMCVNIALSWEVIVIWCEQVHEFWNKISSFSLVFNGDLPLVKNNKCLIGIIEVFKNDATASYTDLPRDGGTLHARDATQLLLVGDWHRVPHDPLVVADPGEGDDGGVSIVNVDRNIHLQKTGLDQTQKEITSKHVRLKYATPVLELNTYPTVPLFWWSTTWVIVDC